MRNDISTKRPQDHETVEEQQEQVQPIRRRTGEEEEEEIAVEDREGTLPEGDPSDHSMEELDEDDLANMQGPDA